MIAEPECHKRNCRWYIGIKNDGTEETERHYCAAFPDMIPDEIAYGDNKHIDPFPNDSGIQYEEQ
jgi:hypothetical protein